MVYAMAEPEDKYRLAACTPEKHRLIDEIIAHHSGEQVLVIGQYLDQLAEVSAHLDAPVITGDTSVKERELSLIHI